MPLTIPYDPSIVLGNIIDPAKLDQLMRISQRQAPIDAAENNLNSLISLKHSIDTTIKELSNMSVDTSKLSEKSSEINKEISEAALAYAEEKLSGKVEIQKIQSESIVNANWESPIDYNRTEIKKCRCHPIR